MFLKNFRVSGALFVLIIQLSVPNGFYSSEGKRRKVFPPSILIWVPPPPSFFCFCDIKAVFLEFHYSVQTTCLEWVV